MPIDLQATGYDDDTAGDDSVGFDVSGDDSTRPTDASTAMDPVDAPTTDVPSDVAAPNDAPDTPPGMTDFMRSFMEAHEARARRAKARS